MFKTYKGTSKVRPVYLEAKMQQAKYNPDIYSVKMQQVGYG